MPGLGSISTGHFAGRSVLIVTLIAISHATLTRNFGFRRI